MIGRVYRIVGGYWSYKRGSCMLNTVLFTLAAWDLKSFLQNLQVYVGDVGSILLTLLGLILVIVSGVKIWRNFTSDGQQRQPKWALTLVGLLVGGAMLATGTSLLIDIAKGGTQTIKDMGGAAIQLETLFRGLFF